MAGRRARIGTPGRAMALLAMALLAMALLATIPVMAGAQASRYGAVANVPMAKRGWTGQGWTGPMDEPDMQRLPADDRRDEMMPPSVRTVPVLRYDIPTSEHAPTQFTGRYVRPYRGWTIPTYFVTSRFQVHDFQAYGLATPGQGRRWIRYYEDAVLVGPGGRVDDVRYGLDRDRAGPGPMARNDGWPVVDAADRAYDAGYDDGYDDGHDGAAEWEDRVPSGGHRADRGGYAPGTVVSTTMPGTITTVTTVTEDVMYTGAPAGGARAALVEIAGRSA